MSDARARIEAAYRHRLIEWGVSRDMTESQVEIELATAIDRLAMLAGTTANPAAHSEQFRDVGRGTTRKELDKLAGLAEALVAHIETLHQPAILALADRGIVRNHASLRWIHALASAARTADISGIPETMGHGRPPNSLATAVARIVIGDAETLTGRKEGYPIHNEREGLEGLPGLVLLVADVFTALGIENNAKAAINAALSHATKDRAE